MAEAIFLDTEFDSSPEYNSFGNMESMYGEEIVHFKCPENDKKNVSVFRLQDLDKNDDLTLAIEDSDSEDDGIEAFNDTPSCGEGVDGQVIVKKLDANQWLAPNYGNKEMCVIQSYIVVKSRLGGLYSICHSCYHLHATGVCFGKHEHVNTHFRRSLVCCETSDMRCATCKNPLFMVVTPEVCVTCNTPKTTKMQHHLVEKKFFG